MNPRLRKALKIVSLLLVLTGIGVAAFPIADYLRMEHYRKKLIEAYNQQFTLDQEAGNEPADFMASIEEPSTEPSTAPLSESPENTSPTEPDGLEAPTHTTTTTTTPENTTYSEELTVIAIISIPKIDVVMPVFSTSTLYAMDFGAVHVAGTTQIGEIGNCGIAAHRGRSKTYFFNRINELEPGDEIVINYQGEDYEYTIYETLIVNPDQVEVLNRSSTEKVLTLISCHPPGTDHYRYIIHALQKPK